MFGLFLFSKLTTVDFGIESAASPVIKKANVITPTKETVGNSDKNMVTRLVAENSSEGELFPHETSGEKVWKKMDILEILG